MIVSSDLLTSQATVSRDDLNDDKDRKNQPKIVVFPEVGGNTTNVASTIVKAPPNLFFDFF